MKAIRSDDLRMYRKLSTIPGIDLNMQDQDGNTILHKLRSNRYRSNIIEEFLNNKTLNINIQNNNGITMLCLMKLL